MATPIMQQFRQWEKERRQRFADNPAISLDWETFYQEKDICVGCDGIPKSPPCPTCHGDGKYHGSQ